MQPVLTPLMGDAILIDACTSPVRGVLERIVPSPTAAVPRLVKPARKAADLTGRMLWRIVGSDILSEGAPQPVCGAMGELFDRVSRQDAVTVTGSVATGQVSALAPPVQGGPGRAGGEEEIGGMPGMTRVIRCAAVRGAPRRLSALTGRWTAGAPVRRNGPHPFRKSLADLRIGDRLLARPRTVTQADIEPFARCTGGAFGAHTDEAAALAIPIDDGHVAHGCQLVSFAAGRVIDPAPGPGLAVDGVDGVCFLIPACHGDALTVTLTAKEISPCATTGQGEIRRDAVVAHRSGEAEAQPDVPAMLTQRRSLDAVDRRAGAPALQGGFLPPVAPCATPPEDISGKMKKGDSRRGGPEPASQLPWWWPACPGQGGVDRRCHSPSHWTSARIGAACPRGPPCA